MCHLRLLKININLRSGKSYDFDILSFLMSLLHIILTSPAILEFNIWFRVALSSFTSTKIHFMTLYVMPMSGLIWAPLPPIHLVHGFNELTLASTTISMIKGRNLIWIKFQKLSLKVCLYFSQQRHSVRQSNEMTRISNYLQRLDPWPGTTSTGICKKNWIYIYSTSDCYDWRPS